MRKRFSAYILTILSLCVIAGCGNAASVKPAPTPKITATVTTAPVLPTATMAVTLAPTATPEPTATPMPTATPEPTPDPVFEKYKADLEGITAVLSASPHKSYSFYPDRQNQTIDGFGASYTWYADWVNLCDDQDKLFDTLFKDAKMTILRFKNEYEYHSEDYAANAETMARYYNEALKRAAEYGEKPTVLMSCWSPKGSLKEGGDITGNASLKKNEDGSYCYDEYAAWWTEAVAYYQSFGFKIDYVCIQNEIEFPASYDGCTFAPSETDTKASFAKAYIAVYNAFKEAFGEDAPKMLGPETMSCKPSTVSSYMKDILAEAPESVDGIAHHLYVGVTGTEATNEMEPDSGISNLSMLNTYFSKYKKWQTEYYLGHALDTAQLINNCMLFENLNAYLYWSGTWTDDGFYSFENGKLIAITYDKNNWYTDNGWYICANYYALRHFSEFVRPGYIRVNSATHDVEVKSSAYVSPDMSKAAVVLINISESEKTFSINGEGYVIDNSHVYQSIFGDTCTTPEQCYMDKGSLGEYYEVVLPAKSVTTIDLSGSFYFEQE